MKICILHIGTNDVNRKSIHKTSPERFINLLDPFLKEPSWTTINCLEDDLPKEVSNYDAYLITGENIRYLKTLIGNITYSTLFKIFIALIFH